ncbi:MAG TPA: hypothetical protein VEV17_12950 [Bryobacteraceae bacterium]|nr:hypothetical protein [Bryobacteraceae bacterium]
MNYRSLVCRGALAVAMAAPLGTQAQSVPPGAAKSTPWKLQHLPDGQPDLQGIWTNITITPMERPAEFAGKAFLTEQEAAEYEKRFIERRDASAEASVNGLFRLTWWDSGTQVVKTRRTSIVIDPPDGKIPALTKEAQAAERARREVARRSAEGPEDRPLFERCIVWPTDGPPMLSSNYNNNYRIVQTPGYVAIYIEMIHDVRLIPLDGRPHLPPQLRSWMGDSVGHWEGDTLVVDTTNFNGLASFRGSDANLHVLERFTRIAADTLLYQFTIDDPTAFTRQWTGEVPWSTAPGPIYEYACHEGNYHTMASMLKAARAEEAEHAPASDRER